MLNTDLLEVSPFIVGVPNITINAETRALITRLKPAGFILFKRNCKNAKQLKNLCIELASLSPFSPPLIFIDQEGGRVNRIDWEEYIAPPAVTIGRIYKKHSADGLEAARLNGFIIASQLAAYGITVNCLPVADIAIEGADPIIGDRAFSEKAEEVSTLCSATISGLLSGGVWPVIKHAPGHGRAEVDSHKSLPIVNTSKKQLVEEWLPFSKNAKCPFMMTAHITYSSLDSKNCATQSPYIINDILQGKIGAEGLIVSDDIGMEALTGDLKTRAIKSLNAGCDLILHCSGKLDELEQLVNIAKISEDCINKLETILPSLPINNTELLNAAKIRMNELLNG